MQVAWRPFDPAMLEAEHSAGAVGLFIRYGQAQRSPAYQEYRRKHHTSSREVAEIAKKARPGLLILICERLWASSLYLATAAS